MKKTLFLHKNTNYTIKCEKSYFLLFHVRKVTYFQAYIFHSTVPLLFLFHFRDRRCLIYLNGALFTSEIAKEINLLCKDYDVGFWLEKNES